MRAFVNKPDCMRAYAGLVLAVMQIEERVTMNEDEDARRLFSTFTQYRLRQMIEDVERGLSRLEHFPAFDDTLRQPWSHTLVSQRHCPEAAEFGYDCLT